MLSKEILLSNPSKLRMGWKINVTLHEESSGLIRTIIGGNSQEDIVPFGGAISLRKFQSARKFWTGLITTSDDLLIHAGDGFQRADTGYLLIADNSGSSVALSDSGSGNFFTNADIGKTVTVYYIPT
jgi:hypothetical protein